MTGTGDRTRELLEALRELLAYGLPIYASTILSLDEGEETFLERVEELLNAAEPR